MPRYILVRETGSTNTYLNRLAKIFPGGTVIYTNKQTAGRGQKGNHWESEPGKNLAFSMLLKDLPVKARDQFAISQAIALAVRDTLADAGGDGFTVKWPNDIYWHDYKIAGILIENSLSGKDIAYSIVGVGVNINQEQFVSDAPNPISLKQITHSEHDLLALLHQMCECIEQTLNNLTNARAKDDLHKRYIAALYRNDGEAHPFEDAQGNRFAAVIDEVAPTGELMLRHTDGDVRTYLFKEVKHVIHDNLSI